MIYQLNKIQKYWTHRKRKMKINIYNKIIYLEIYSQNVLASVKFLKIKVGTIIIYKMDNSVYLFNKTNNSNNKNLKEIISINIW